MMKNPATKSSAKCGRQKQGSALRPTTSKKVASNLMTTVKRMERKMKKATKTVSTKMKTKTKKVTITSDIIWFV